MGKHKPTPWAYKRAVRKLCESVDEETIIADGIGFSSGPRDPWSEANSARIVAAVNAFHSDDGREIQTEQITEGLFWRMLDALKFGVQVAKNTGLDVAEPRAVLDQLEGLDT